MKDRYLEVTYRHGKLLAAYLYLPRQPGDRSARVAKHGSGLIVDLAADGRAIGIEFIAPAALNLDQVNEVLRTYGLPLLEANELAPLKRAA